MTATARGRFSMLSKGCALHSPAGLSKVARRFDCEEHIALHGRRVKITSLHAAPGVSGKGPRVAATTGKAGTDESGTA